MKSFVTAFLFLIASFSSEKTLEQTHDLESVCLSAEELKLYDQIMEYRKSARLPVIPLSAKLSQVAKAHTRDLMDNYTFDINNKCNPHSWSDKGSWTSCCYTSDHKQASCMWAKPKEIAGYDGNGYEIAYYTTDEAQAQEALDGWKKSPGHNPLLINSGIWQKVKWQGIGISLYKNYGVVWFGEIGDSTRITRCN